MEVQPTTVRLAFPDGKQYAIPSYQRNYVWTRDGQWGPLWDDLKTLAEHSIEDSSTRSHFLGTIITKQIGTQGFTDRWSVVDGQQRLTTLQILMAAVRSAFHELGLDQYASILTKSLVNPQEGLRKDSDKYKIQHKSSDYQGFSEIIESSVEGADPTERDRRQLDECHAYFKAAVAEWLAAESDTTCDRRAEALTQTLLLKFYVVDIRLDRQENGHAIFEALNARAEPLTEWEKTKNYILSIAARDDDPDGDRAYSAHLERYDSDPYWDQSFSEQRFSGKRVEYFLFFFAQIELPKRRHEATGKPVLDTLPRTRLYREFRSVGEHDYRRSPEALQGFLRRLKRYADIYRQLDEASSDTFSGYARLVMHRRRGLRLASLIPVFMVLVDKLGHDERLDRALRIIDSYLMRRVAVKANYSGFDDVAFRFVQALADTEPNEVVAVLIRQFDQATTWTSRWPNDEEVGDRLRETDMYHRCAGKGLLLSGIAERMHDERSGDLTMHFRPKDKLTVEHVAPQNWNRHWKSELGFGDTDEERHRLNRLVHRVGNLTLVTSKLNNNLGDHPWRHKAKLLRTDNLEMNRRLLDDMEGATWNQEEIDRRSRLIANYVKEIWPHTAALRREMGIVAPVEEAADRISGILPEVAQRLVDSVTETGIADGWAGRDGLNRARREERYGRYLNLGGGARWHCYWFGESTEYRHLILDSGEESDSHLIQIPEDLDFDDVLESLTTQVRDVADSIGSTGVSAGG